MNTTPQPLLEASAVSKRFGHVEALRRVDFSVRPGEIVGLVGDNGAGKSTLIRIINGVFQPDGGRLLWEGTEIHPKSPREMQELGVATVFQDLALVDLMNVHRNVFLGREEAVSRRIGSILWYRPKQARALAEEVLTGIGIDIRDTDEAVANLSGGERQSIAIAQAIHFGARLLILDEPTSQLSVKETSKVLAHIEQSRDRGVSVVFITHNVRHVYQVADRFCVLSHGRSLGQFDRSELSEDAVTDMIVSGRVAPPPER